MESCAALKNAYTLAVGLAGGMLIRAGGVDEAGAGMHNLAAGLFGASAAEMVKIVGLLGGDANKVAGLPGVGDEYVTCVGGPTIRLGTLLGKGLNYTQAVLEMAGKRPVRVADMANGLNRTVAEMDALVSRLVRKGMLVRREHQGESYYSRGTETD